MNNEIAVWKDEVIQDAHSRADHDKEFTVSQKIARSLKNIATLSEVLRFSGAAIVIASMSSFMLQDWGNGTDIQRYFLLLMQTGLLTAGGLTLSFGLKENKGARLSFALALISIVANFTILGALIYSLVQWDTGFVNYPKFAHWIADSPQTLMLTITAAFAVIIPVARFAFMVLARPSAWKLTSIFLAANSLLLLPFRGSVFVSFSIITGLLGVYFLSSKVLGEHHTLKTPEGYFARALLYAPVLVIVVRSLYLYSPDAILSLTAFGAIYFMLRITAVRFASNIKGVDTLNLLSYVITFCVAASTWELIDQLLNYDFAYTAYACVMAALSFDILARVHHRWLNRLIVHLSSIVFAGAFIIVAFGPSGLVPTVLSLMAALVQIGYAWKKREPFVMITGVLTLICSLYIQLEHLIELLFVNNWVVLAVIGISTIVLASLLDRHGVTMKLKLQSWWLHSRADQVVGQ